VFRERNSLLKVGVIMMTLALALLIAVVVVGVTLGSEPERVVAAEVARKSPGEAPRYPSREEGSATKKPSSEKEFTRYLSGEELLAYGSSSGEEQVGKGVGQATQQAGEATQEADQAAQEVGDGASQAARFASDVGGQSTEQAGQAGDASQQATRGTQEDPGQTVEGTAASGAQVLSESSDEAGRTVRRVVEESGSIVEQTLSKSGEVSEEAVAGEASTNRETSEENAGVQVTPAAERKAEVKEPQAVLQQEDAEPQNSRSATPQLGSKQTPSEAPSVPEPQSQQHQTQPQEQPLPGAEQRGWTEPTQTELKTANQGRRYELLPGAVMGLTIEAIGIIDAPVFDSDRRWALANGVAHHPQTSLPWSQSAQRNVYLAGHRMGYGGTWSRMIFYNLDKLREGDKVVLKDRTGTSYRYRVSEVLVTDPTGVWVMGQVRGRDMVTLQTCTPYPTFEKRLIVRADRV
jgi:sortase A